MPRDDGRPLINTTKKRHAIPGEDGCGDVLRPSWMSPNLGAKQSFREETPNTVWGGYGYTTDLDALRAEMTISEHPVSADQLIITFTDMSQQGGNLTVWWDTKIATIPFQVAN